MKVSYISDLHLEHWYSYGDIDYQELFSNKEEADVLVLAGDILLAEAIIRFPFFKNNTWTDSKYEYLSRKFQEVLQYCAANYKDTLFVCGNHEFYGAKYHKVFPALNESFESLAGNVFLLNESTICINGVLFHGSTLWTDMGNGNPANKHIASEYMNDYRAITFKDSNNNYRKLSPTDTVWFNQVELDYIHHSLSSVVDSHVVITHHAPTYKSIAKEYTNSPLNPAYANNLEDFILDNQQIKYWIHGHVHKSCDYMVGDTRVLCNPAGYPKENADSFSDITLKTFEV